MQELALREHLQDVRDELERVQAEYAALNDLAEGYVRLLNVLGLEDAARPSDSSRLADFQTGQSAIEVQSTGDAVGTADSPEVAPTTGSGTASTGSDGAEPGATGNELGDDLAGIDASAIYKGWPADYRSGTAA